MHHNIPDSAQQGILGTAQHPVNAHRTGPIAGAGGGSYLRQEAMLASRMS